MNARVFVSAALAAYLGLLAPAAAVRAQPADAASPAAR